MEFVEKMNYCLLIGLRSKTAQRVIDECFDQMAEFAKTHGKMGIEKFPTLRGEKITRQIILNMYMDDLYDTIKGV